MSHSWKHIFGMANEAAKASVEQKLADGIDPKVQLNQAIQEMQEQYGKLKAAAAVVMADAERAQQRRGQLQRAADRLTVSIKAALAKGDQDQARRFAVELDNNQQEIAHLDESLPGMQDAADAAKHHLEAFAQAMEEKMRQRTQLLASLDQAKANEQLDAALRTMSDMSASSTVPSFEQISEKIDQRAAVAKSSVSLNAADPRLAELDAHVQEQNDRADMLLASFQAEALPAGEAK